MIDHDPYGPDGFRFRDSARGIHASHTVSNPPVAPVVTPGSDRIALPGLADVGSLRAAVENRDFRLRVARAQLGELEKHLFATGQYEIALRVRTILDDTLRLASAPGADAARAELCERCGAELPVCGGKLCPQADGGER
ncbi:MAG: hypothetical protein JWO05_1163 [Gemmatimonadetes bacterium]|nr:hypothetical protein [Gemmatimonadota bacterium]